uniref:Uncharacterized protein n=1 Tax=Oryza barthii TaxID=65489 RepID=A0A0D3ES40_9ORYZ
MQVQAASPATAASSPVAPSPPPPPRAALSPCPRRRELLLLSASLPLPLPLLAPAAASARGLFRMPPPRLANRYFLVRAGGVGVRGAGRRPHQPGLQDLRGQRPLPRRPAASRPRRARAAAPRRLRGRLLDMALHHPARLPGRRDHRRRQRDQPQPHCTRVQLLRCAWPGRV